MRSDGPDMAQGFYHMVFYRMNGYRQLFRYFLIRMPMHAAEDENFFPYRGKGTGQGMQIIVLFEPCAGLNLGIFSSLCGLFGKLGEFFALGVLAAEIIYQGSGGDAE